MLLLSPEDPTSKLFSAPSIPSSKNNTIELGADLQRIFWDDLEQATSLLLRIANKLDCNNTKIRIVDIRPDIECIGIEKGWGYIFYKNIWWRAQQIARERLHKILPKWFVGVGNIYHDEIAARTQEVLDILTPKNDMWPKLKVYQWDWNTELPPIEERDRTHLKLITTETRKRRVAKYLGLVYSWITQDNIITNWDSYALVNPKQTHQKIVLEGIFDGQWNLSANLRKSNLTVEDFYGLLLKYNINLGDVTAVSFNEANGSLEVHQWIEKKIFVLK